MTTPVDLRLDDITVRFGGLVAVDHVSLVAPAGQITGLIGPNGAGKSTLFDATCGVTPPQEGTVHLGDRSLSGRSPSARAEAGLGRTFQRMRLFDSLTVAENVAAGPEMRLAGRRPWTHLVATRAQRRTVLDQTDDALERCGITGLADRIVGDLSTGQRRLVELARALASRFDFLLLDEPSSGLDVGETEHFAAVLGDTVAREGLGLLVVEHDMALVRSLCTSIYVLDFGKLIFSGPAAEVLASELVQAAYLGSASVEEAVA